MRGFCCGFGLLALAAIVPTGQAEAQNSYDTRVITNRFCQQAVTISDPAVLRAEQRAAIDATVNAQGPILRLMRDAFAAHSAARATHEQLRQQYEGMRIDQLIASWATPGSYVGAALLGSPSGDRFALAHRQLTAQAEEVARTRRVIHRLRSEMRRDEMARETIAECAARRQRALAAMGRSAPPAAPSPAGAVANAGGGQTFEMRLFHVNPDGSLGGAGYAYRLRLVVAASGAITGQVLENGSDVMGEIGGQRRGNDAAGSWSLRGVGMNGQGRWEVTRLDGDAQGLMCLRSTDSGNPITKRVGVFWNTTPLPGRALSAAQLC